MAYRQIGLVTIRCSQCGADLGTFMYAGISTAICTGCQKINAELEKNKTAPAVVPHDHAVAGEDFVIRTAAPEILTDTTVPEPGFDAEAKKLFSRAKKAVTKKKKEK